MKILSGLFLKKVNLINENTIELLFDEITKQSTNSDFRVGGAIDLMDFFETIKIEFAPNEETQKIYSTLSTLIGECMVLEFKNNKVMFWERDIDEPDVHDFYDYFSWLSLEMNIVKYDMYKVDKTAEDWKNCFQDLQKVHYKLLAKKGFQVDELRVKVVNEIKDKLELKIKDYEEGYFEQNMKKLMNEMLYNIKSTYTRKSGFLNEFIFEIDEK